MSRTIELSIRAWVIVTYCPNFLFGQYTKSSSPFTELDQSTLSSSHLLPFSSSPFSSAAVPLSITITSLYPPLFSLYSTLQTTPRPIFETHNWERKATSRAVTRSAAKTCGGGGRATITLQLVYATSQR